MSEIAVGFDESAGAASALRWALQEGRLRSWGVSAVLAWDLGDQHQLDPTAGFDADFDQGAAEAVLAEAVTSAVGGDAAGQVEQEAVEGRAAQALIDRAANAQLLVVGARGLGGLKGRLRGSVSQQLAHHAPCTLVVVP